MHTDRPLAEREPKLGRFEAIEARQIEQEGLTNKIKLSSQIYLGKFLIISIAKSIRPTILYSLANTLVEPLKFYKFYNTSFINKAHNEKRLRQRTARYKNHYFILPFLTIVFDKRTISPVEENQ